MWELLFAPSFSCALLCSVPVFPLLLVFKYKVSPNSSFLHDPRLLREAHFICALFQKHAIKLLSEGMTGSCELEKQRLKKSYL